MQTESQETAAENTPVERAVEAKPVPFEEGTRRVQLLGVDYLRCRTQDGGDLYLTEYGEPFYELLQPENWLAQDWFEANRCRLEGTSVVYRLPTRTKVLS